VAMYFYVIEDVDENSLGLGFWCSIDIFVTSLLSFITRGIVLMA
jgi:hypothetical protein